MMTVSITISLLLVSILNSSKHEVSRDETASQNKCFVRLQGTCVRMCKGKSQLIKARFQF